MTDELDTLAPDRGGRGTEGRIQEFPLGVVAASASIFGFGVQLHGWCVAESTGAAGARIRLRDGRGVEGSVVAPISVVANGTAALWLGEDGVAAESGLYVEVLAGSVEVTIYARAPLSRRPG